MSCTHSQPRAEVEVVTLPQLARCVPSSGIHGLRVCARSFSLHGFQFLGFESWFMV